MADDAVARNLQRMDELDFAGWNQADWEGVFIDAGRITDGLADRLRQEVLSAYPTPVGDRSLADAIVAHASRSGAAAPPGSLAFELLRQHREAEHARVRRQESPERRQPSWPTKQ